MKELANTNTKISLGVLMLFVIVFFSIVFVRDKYYYLGLFGIDAGTIGLLVLLSGLIIFSQIDNDIRPVTRNITRQFKRHYVIILSAPLMSFATLTLHFDPLIEIPIRYVINDRGIDLRWYRSIDTCLLLTLLILLCSILYAVLLKYHMVTRHHNDHYINKAVILSASLISVSAYNFIIPFMTFNGARLPDVLINTCVRDSAGLWCGGSGGIAYIDLLFVFLLIWSGVICGYAYAMLFDVILNTIYDVTNTVSKNGTVTKAFLGSTNFVPVYSSVLFVMIIVVGGSVSKDIDVRKSIDASAGKNVQCISYEGSSWSC